VVKSSSGFKIYLVFCDANIRFRPAAVKELIHQVLTEYLNGKDYKGAECSDWCKDISNEIKVKIKGSELYFNNLSDLKIILST